MKAYAAYYRNKVRLESSSGGLFSAIANHFDIVYGVAMTDDCYGCHFIRVYDGNITPLRGSKYMQAKVGDIFNQVKEDVLAGKKVLFSGTACQINGLSCFLGAEYPNLLLLDIICHGTPSIKLWRKYIRNQELKAGKINHINFRCKEVSWQQYGFKENDYFIPHEVNSYMRMFQRDYCLRPSCYECQAKTFRKSDITIGDFWGIEKVVPELNDNYGTSLIITRTERGQSIFDKIKESLNWEEVAYENSVQFNHFEYESVFRPTQRSNFYKDLEKLPFERMEKKYASEIKVSFIKRILRKIKRILKHLINQMIFVDKFLY